MTYFSPLCFFFNAPATTEIYTLSLHDALPISARSSASSTFRRQWISAPLTPWPCSARWDSEHGHGDRKSTRLNSSHRTISYAVFCLKKKNIITKKVRHQANYRSSFL